MATTPPVPQPVVSNAPASNTPDPSQTQTQQPSQQPQAQPSQQSTSAPTQPQQDNGLQPQTASTNATVPNVPLSQAPAPPVHPAVQNASILRETAMALAGGPRYQTTVNPVDGTVTKTQVPLSKGDISMAIISSLLSGGLAGLSQRGPGAVGRAAGAGFQQVSQQAQQADQEQQQQTQTDLKNQTSALVRQGQTAELNSRIALNTSQAERLGVQNIKDLAAQNAPIIQAYKDKGLVDDEHAPQQKYIDGMASGKNNATKETGLIDGFTLVNGKPQATFAHITDPSAKIPLTQQQWDNLADAGVQGFPKGTKIPDGYQITGSQLAIAMQKAQANRMMEQEAGSVSTALSQSKDPQYQAMAKDIPDFRQMLSDPKTGPTLQYALGKFQRYISHSNLHGMDIYQSLQQMAQPSKPDPQHQGQFIPNPDAPLANTIAGAYGNGDPQKGWQILKAFHDEVTPTPIKNVAEAQSIESDPTSTPQEKAHAAAVIALDSQKKAADAGATAKAKAKYAKPAGGAGADAGGAPQPGTQRYNDLIESAYRGNVDTEQSLRYGKPWLTRFTADIVAAHPDFNAGQFRANLKLLDSFTSGKGAQTIAAMNALSDHVSDAEANVNALQNTNAALLNKPLNQLRSMSNDPQVGPMVVRLLAVKSQLLTVLDNGHAAHDADLQQMANGLNQNQTPAQMLSTLKQIQQTAQIQADAQNGIFKAQFHKNANGYRPVQGSGDTSTARPNANAPQIKPGQRMVTIPAGASQVRDAGKNVIGYMLNGKYIPLGGR